MSDAKLTLLPIFRKRAPTLAAKGRVQMLTVMTAWKTRREKNQYSRRRKPIVRFCQTLQTMDPVTPCSYGWLSVSCQRSCLQDIHKNNRVEKNPVEYWLGHWIVPKVIIKVLKMFDHPTRKHLTSLYLTELSLQCWKMTALMKNKQKRQRFLSVLVGINLMLLLSHWWTHWGGANPSCHPAGGRHRPGWASAPWQRSISIRKCWRHKHQLESQQVPGDSCCISAEKAL